MPSIVEIVKYWSEDYLKHLALINRSDYLGIKVTDKNFATAYIGVRRSGKTFIALNEALQEMQKKSHKNKRFLYINFEDQFFINNNQVDILDSLLETFVELYSHEPEFIVLDEIQNIQYWEKWLRKQIDSKRYRIIVTGSSAKMLSSELATSLTGRALERKVYPLSFKEYLQFRTIEKVKSDKEYLGLLKEYFTYGAFPAVVLEDNLIRRNEILAQYLNDIIYKDIVSRYEIRQLAILQNIIQYYLTNISSLHSYNKVKNAFNTQVETVQDYSHFCETAFLLFFVKKYERNLKVQARNPQKVYCIDPGIRNSRSITEDIGKIAENIVFIELKRRGKEVFYHKDKYEADFLVVDKYTVTEVIQVSYSNLEDKDTYEREVNGALEAMQTHKLSSSLILTKNLHDIKKIDGKKIIFKPVYEFLLES